MDSSPAPSDDGDSIPWLLIAAAIATVTVVAGVAAIATDGYWWVVALITLVLAATAGGAEAVVRLTSPRRDDRPAPVPGGPTAHGPGHDWRGPEGSPHVLVVASEPVDRTLLRPAVTNGAAVLIVAPAITNNRLRYWVSDTDAARERAEAVKRQSVAARRDAGVAADGHVGSGDPLTAIDDALRFFDAELIVLSSRTSGRRGYREPPLRTDVERRFGLPVAELDPPRLRALRRPRRSS